MKALQDYKISNPTDRFERINKFLKNIQEAQEFGEFEINLSIQEHTVQGKVLHPPSLLPGRDSKSKQVFWDDYTRRKVEHAEPTNLQEEKWCLMYSLPQGYDRANDCLAGMRNACPTFGIKVADPFWIEVPENYGKLKDGLGFIKHCEESKITFANYKFVVVILSDPKHKKAVKAYLDQKSIAS